MTRAPAGSSIGWTISSAARRGTELMMSDRIHAHLDGHLPLEALTPDERVRAVALARAADAAAAHLRAVRAPSGLSARVMAALPGDVPRRSPAAALLAWLWSPRPVRVSLRPAYGFALALAAVVLLLLPRPHPSRSAARTALPAEMAAAPPRVYVQFRVEVPDAHTVALAGSFTGWQPRYALKQTGPGEWTALVPLRPGVHDYAFVVDGRRWIPDPNAPQVDDSFGGTNSRISLPPLGAS